MFKSFHRFVLISVESNKLITSDVGVDHFPYTGIPLALVVSVKFNNFGTIKVLSLCGCNWEMKRQNGMVLPS